LVGRDSLSED
jgi:V-type H+-transporting ATPase subunit A